MNGPCNIRRQQLPTFKFSSERPSFILFFFSFCFSTFFFGLCKIEDIASLFSFPTRKRDGERAVGIWYIYPSLSFSFFVSSQTTSTFIAWSMEGKGKGRGEQDNQKGTWWTCAVLAELMFRK